MAKLFRHHVSWRLVLLIACESALIMEAVVFAAWISLGNDAWRLMVHENGWWKETEWAVSNVR